MEILKFLFEHFWSTVCLLVVFFSGLAAIVRAFKGKNTW